MSVLTTLEKQVVELILHTSPLKREQITELLGVLTVRERTFSTDARNKALCCGFYVNFAENEIARTGVQLPTHLGIQASHPKLRVGADFVLFFRKNAPGLDLLEATFFDQSYPITDLQSDPHGFVIGKPAVGK